VAVAGDEATVYLYDVIDPYWGIGADEFVRELSAISAGTIHLRINSPGGDVFDGRAIATAVAQHPSHVVAHIDGLAASAASYVAIAADAVRIADGAMVMVHNAWTLAFGNKTDLRGLADVLEKIDGTIAADYARKTGKSLDEIVAWMDAETWFTAAEALDAGLVDAIDAITPSDPDARANAWNLSAFANAPKLPPQPAPDVAHEQRRRLAALLQRIG
jgi:ATP-dependent Clp protease protease subunit